MLPDGTVAGSLEEFSLAWQVGQLASPSSLGLGVITGTWWPWVGKEPGGIQMRPGEGSVRATWPWT